MQRTLVMIGVAGCGKSEIGQRLASRLGGRFVEGDALHEAGNVAKMAGGVPLTDADRQVWLLRLQRVIAAARTADETIVVSCSALKRRYRQTLREGDAALFCVHLRAGREVLQARMRARTHFMPVALLDSQLREFEPLAGNEAGICIDVDTAAPDDVVARIAGMLESHH